MSGDAGVGVARMYRSRTRQRVGFRAPKRLSYSWRLGNELAGVLELGRGDRRCSAFALVELEDLTRVEIEGCYHEHVAVVVVNRDLGGARRRSGFVRFVLAVVDGKHLVP